MGSSFGRGGATQYVQDLSNADCIVIQGSNMAECHPVAYQWVTEARLKGAKVIHVDPRFTRTSATADKHIPIRVGSDVVLLGALINHILSNELYFREYVVAYTNAATLVSEDYQDTEDLDGLFSGYDDEKGGYAQDTWAYASNDDDDSASPGTIGGPAATHEDGDSQSERSAGDQHGSGGPALEHSRVLRDETLEDPNTVFQILKRHYARYTPEMVAETCGVSVEDFHYLAKSVTENSGRERTTAFVYAVGWTQHTLGAQFIRTAAIVQLLLGNMGRPGGGIMALRGHASIQGSTDIPTLYNILPGYLAMPVAGMHDTWDAYLAAIGNKKQKGFWANADTYAVSLMKAWWGKAATAENDWAFGNLPRLTGAHGTYQTTMAMKDGEVEGYFLLGQNPAVGSAHGRLQRQAMAQLKWLVVRDLNMIESATFWRDGPEIVSGETEDRGHRDRGLLPARRGAHGEERLLHPDPADAPVAPPGRAAPGRLPERAAVLLRAGRPMRELLADSGDERDRPLLDLTWDYPVDEHGEPSAEAVLAEINGRHVTGDKAGQPLSSYTEMRADGSTEGGCWIYTGVYAGGANHAADRKPGQRAGPHRTRLGLGLAGEPPDPLQPRLGRPRGQPVERAQEVHLVGRRAGQVDRSRRARLRHRQGAVLPARAGHGWTGRSRGR